MDKEHMFWGNATYGAANTPKEDKIRVPRVTYRCKVKTTGHLCKKVTDHAGAHECICGKEL